MSFANNEETKLFTQLSEEQQEVVSGGGDYGKADNLKFDDFGLSKTKFEHSSSDLKTLSASGKDGSIATGKLSAEDFKTTGLNVVGFG